MKVIFSRKGFDSGAGGCASPIINGRPVSLPIPTRMPSSTRFRDVSGNIATLADELSNCKVQADSFCHLDPDLDPGALPRKPDWRGSLGQVSAAQGHLRNQNVCSGDLFLFWGLFRPAEYMDQWQYTGAKEHRIFGWLQIHTVVAIGVNPDLALRQYPWLADHPHLRPGWPESNTIYLAREYLTLGEQQLDIPGWGLFPSGHRLSKNGSPLPSVWTMPNWINPKRGGVGMTYHPEHRWSEDGLLSAAARGQEFVTDIGNRADAISWIMNLFEEVL